MLSVVPPPPEETASPVLQVGDTLGPYVIEELLGEGTMGRVYRARHQRLGRMVALKVLHSHLIQDKGLVARFLQEARLVNQINHAHIVEVHDFVEELFPERVYGVMELLRGKTLAATLAERALSVAEICSVGKQIADALNAAHRVDVVHRDLKPDNIFLTSREGHPDAVPVRVKVLDFGVAKLLQNSGDLRVADTQSGAMVGTPRYMAPEQAAGLEVDGRTDIYALGTILYEMIAGNPPFTSTVFGQLAADIITQPPPPLPDRTQAGEPIPAQLLELIATCLKKRSEDRPPSMAAIAAWLERVNEAPAKKPPSKGALVAGAGAALLAVVGILVIALRPAAAPAVPVVKPEERVVVVKEPVVAPPPVITPTDVSLSFVTTPAKANVLNVETGALLGVTPLSLKLPKADKPLRVRFELKGYEPLERETSLQSDQALELSLKANARPRSTKVVKDGVIDPF